MEASDEGGFADEVAFHRGKNLSGQRSRGCGRQAEQHDATGRGQAGVEGQVTEILVERQEDAALPDRSRQYCR